MLLIDYKKVVEIDQTINELHKKLAELYAQRSGIVASTGSQAATTNTTRASNASASGSTAIIDDEWVRDCYDDLQEAWVRYDIKIPSFTTLKRKLAAAQVVLDDILPEYGASFNLLLVPPAKLFSLPLTDEIAEKSNLIFSPALPAAQTVAKGWKLFVVYTDSLAPKVEDYAHFVAKKNPVFAGYEMPGLDCREYTAFLLMSYKAIDENSWSLLIRDGDIERGLVPCVTRMGDSYHFEMDATAALIGQNHFRPAMEIK